tara:strand:+ start:384 stop:563 length:180 start_codon:yes stop_codon:yes gene_type:complete
MIEKIIDIPIEVLAIKFVKSLLEFGFTNNNRKAPIKGKKIMKKLYQNIISLLVSQCHRH